MANLYSLANTLETLRYAFYSVTTESPLHYAVKGDPFAVLFFFVTGTAIFTLIFDQVTGHIGFITGESSLDVSYELHPK